MRWAIAAVVLHLSTETDDTGSIPRWQRMFSLCLWNATLWHWAFSPYFIYHYWFYRLGWITQNVSFTSFLESLCKLCEVNRRSQLTINLCSEPTIKTKLVLPVFSRGTKNNPLLKCYLSRVTTSFSGHTNASVERVVLELSGGDTTVEDAVTLPLRSGSHKSLVLQQSVL